MGRITEGYEIWKVLKQMLPACVLKCALEGLQIWQQNRRQSMIHVELHRE
jgi:hypothetical protein